MNRLCLFFSLVLLLPLKSLYGQSMVALDVNQVSALFSSDGNLFWDGMYAGYFVPYQQWGSNKSPIFAASLWFHALDSNGDTLMAAEMYRQNGSDFGEGALPPGASIGFTPVYDSRIFNLHHEQVESGRKDSTELLKDVVEWPISYSHNGNAYQLAPFIDVNGNGIFEPTKGDYPFYFGDQSLFFVYHDMVDHALTKTKPLGVQIITQAYAYNIQGNKLNDYIFVRYKIVSQNQNLTQFRVGVFSDYDLGNYSDDYVGTDTSRNMIYVMNGDDDDEGFLGYGLNPPAFATVFLNQPLCGSCVGENKYSGINRIPTQPHEFANFLLTLDMNGDSQEVQMPGVPANTYSNYAFTGDPTQFSGWTMQSDPRYAPGDYRMMGVTGRDTLARGDTFELLLLYVFARASSNNGLGARGGLIQLQEDVDDLFDRYFTKPLIRPNCFSGPSREDTSGQGTGIFETSVADKPVIYPNPATDFVTVELSNPNAEFSCVLMDELGREFIQTDGVGNTALDCSALPNGIYYIRLIAKDSGQSTTRKLVIIRP